MEIRLRDMREVITFGRDRISLEWVGITFEQDGIT
jgi:hypothetical protein